MESKPVEWQKLFCFEVKRAYSISNGAHMVDLCGMLGYKKFFISYYRDEYMVGIILIVQSGQLKNRSSSGNIGKRQQDSGTHRSRKG